MEFSFFFTPPPPPHTHFFFLLDGVQQIMQKKVESMRVWVRWLGFESVVDGRLILCMCESARVCSRELAISTAPYLLLSQSTLLSLALCTLEKVFISPAPKHSRVFTVKGEKASVLHTCFSVCSYILQAGSQTQCERDVNCSLNIKQYTPTCCI